MTEDEWATELKTYKTSEQCLKEVIEGIDDHLNTKCQTGKTQTVATRGSQPRAPFKQEPVFCDRGSSGCGLVHNDLQALRFTQMGLHRLRELS